MALFAVSPNVGILCLGIFVGFLLGIGLYAQQINIRAALAVIGGALGAAPLAFIGGGNEKFMYPVGLIVGLLLTRLGSAAETIRKAMTGPASPTDDTLGWAIIEVIFLLVVTGAALVYAFVSS
jgi:hypothetical protein